MEKRAVKTRSGLTLIEIMVGLAVIVVGVLGAMMYRYSSALHARKADVQVGAGRVGLLILESWKGAGGVAGFDPKNINLNGNLGGGSPDILISGTGPYTVQLTGGTLTYYYVTLPDPIDGDTNDLTGDGNNDPGLLKIEVAVTYYGKGSQTTTQPSKTIKFAGFVRN